jgi:V8-like Glu-specific endopeptidase
VNEFKNKKAVLNLKPNLLLAALIGFNCLPAPAAIFGKDNREEVSLNSTKHLVAKSTAISLLKSNYEVNKLGKVQLNTQKLSEFMCQDEKFSRDESLSYSCTGFLVAPNLLVTAGHCMTYLGGTIENKSDGFCEVFDWLFDFAIDDNGSLNTNNISSEKVYRCKQILIAKLDDQAPYQDFALIELDRPVQDRSPLKLSNEVLKVGQNVSMAGYPFGTPLKWSGSAKVTLNNLSRDSFVTNLSAFQGNSGSPVFNSQDEVIGILISGTPSVNTAPDKGGLKCERYNRCDENGQNCLWPDLPSDLMPGFQKTGSEVQKISPIIDAVRFYLDAKPTSTK